jgi:hypothetical protein
MVLPRGRPALNARKAISAAYDGFALQSISGDTVVLSNAGRSPTVASPCERDPVFLNTGYDLTLTLRGAGRRWVGGRQWPQRRRR